MLIEKNEWKKLVKRHNKCELCKADGRQYQMHGHHIEKKSSNYMRTLLDNGICLCANCHAWGIHDTSWSRQKEISDQILAYKGQEFMDNLKRLKNSPPKMSITELEELRKEYKEKADKFNL